MTDILTEQFTDVFNRYAAEGIARFQQDTPEAPPSLSHVCFKFVSLESYAEYVDAARSIGKVTQEEFNGKQITWCKLDKPLRKGELTLEWLELVEPRVEKHGYDGVANIGYAVPSLEGAVKLSSSDGAMIFRYQKNHAVDMAPK